MECKACTEANANPLAHSFHSSCLECSARMLAHSPAAFKALRAITATDLQQAIARTFGQQGTAEYEHGRQRVWHWIQLIKQARQPAEE